MKLKTCTDCEEQKSLWKASPPLCKNCALRRKYTLTQTTDGKQAKPKRISIFSKQRMEALKIYRKVRDQFLKENPACQFPGCTSRQVQLHHSRGRVGTLLTDPRYFKSLCPAHHRFVEEHPLEARKMGLSESRLNN